MHLLSTHANTTVLHIIHHEYNHSITINATIEALEQGGRIVDFSPAIIIYHTIDKKEYTGKQPRGMWISVFNNHHFFPHSL
mmetsp:Transcript_11467/g.21445  ORF Transcript_11467/g.21445 Transcript_11467/m.21445 type:complete len:81 (+) Transcript_11467:154-396(+)